MEAYQRTVEEALQEQHSSMHGLSEAQAQERSSVFGLNKLQEEKKSIPFETAGQAAFRSDDHRTAWGCAHFRNHLRICT